MMEFTNKPLKIFFQLFLLFLTIQLSVSLYEIEVYKMFGYEENGNLVGTKIS